MLRPVLCVQHAYTLNCKASQECKCLTAWLLCKVSTLAEGSSMNVWQWRELHVSFMNLPDCVLYVV